MKKIRVLLTLVGVVAAISVSIATRARVTSTVYTKGADGYCTVRIIYRSMITVPFSNVYATTLYGAPCNPASLFDPQIN